MNDQENIITAAAELPFVCLRHPQVELTHRLAGGAGHCRECNYFQQSLNHEMPLLPPRPPKPKRAQKAAAKQCRATKRAAKAVTKRAPLKARTTSTAAKGI